MALSDLFDWNGDKKAAANIGRTACGTADEPEKKPTSGGAGGEPEEQHAYWGAACGAGDRPKEQPTSCGASDK